MDSSISFKPSRAAIGKAVSGRDPVTVREAAETDLDRTKTVAPAGGGSGGWQHDHKSDQQRGDHRSAEHVPGDLLANPESRDLIYRVQAQPQLEQARLRQRAYQGGPSSHLEAQQSPVPDPHADIKA